MVAVSPGNAPLQLRSDGGTVVNYGPGDLVYGDDQGVSIDVFDGALPAGQTLPINGTLWFLAPTAAAQVDIVTTPSGALAPTARHATGRYYYPVGLPSAASALTINQLMAVPLAVGRTLTLDRICVNIGAVGTAGSVVRLGLYTDRDGLPDSLLLDAGTVDSTSTGAKEKTISQILPAGWVWLAGVAQVAVPQVARMQGIFWPMGFTASTVTNSALASAMIHSGATSGALPATFLPTTNNVGFVITVRAA